MLPVLYNNHYQIVQSKDTVTILVEMVHDARIVRIGGEHVPANVTKWMGDSVGHYEGDTLVVDTVGFNTKTFVDNYRTPHSAKLHVVERFHLTEGGKTLEVHLTVDDPDTFNAPWQAIRRYGRTQATLGEEICQEGNFTLFDYGIPVAKTSDF